MSESKLRVPVYCMPGMCASPAIFDRIQWPDHWDVYYLTWHMPIKNESLSSYIQTLSQQIKHENPVLVGVSLGGVMVQEIACTKKIRKLILISTVTQSSEKSWFQKFCFYFPVHRLVIPPYVWFINQMVQKPLGAFFKKAVPLIKVYLPMRERSYVDWSVNTFIQWKSRPIRVPYIHIHGTKDELFPYKRMGSQCIAIENGTHAMIVTKANLVSEKIKRAELDSL